MQSPYRPTPQKTFNTSRSSVGEHRPAVPPSYHTAMAKRTDTSKQVEVRTTSNHNMTSQPVGKQNFSLIVCADLSELFFGKYMTLLHDYFFVHFICDG